MSAPAFDPLHALRVLIDHKVRFILIGGIAGRLHGSNLITNDLDICYAFDDEDRERLAAALQELDAKLRGAPVEGRSVDTPKGFDRRAKLAVDRPKKFILDARTFKNGGNFTFSTVAGALDCLGHPTGTQGYCELQSSAVKMELDGLEVFVASIDDLIDMKKAAGSPQDLYAVEVLGALREEQDHLERRRRRR